MKVLDISPPNRGRKKSERLDFLNKLIGESPSQVMQDIIAYSQSPVSLDIWSRAMNQSPLMLKDAASLIGGHEIIFRQEVFYINRQLLEKTQNTIVNYPIIADPNFEVSKLYGFVHPNASDKFTVRSVVIIGADKKVKLLITYPASTGRNFDEILRVIDSLQLTANHSVATPANWKYGEDVVVIPAIKTEDIPAKFPKGHKVIKPYLRTTPQPNL